MTGRIGNGCAGVKAEDIDSFDVTPSWERPPAEVQESDVAFGGGLGCRCGLCQLAAAGHL